MNFMKGIMVINEMIKVYIDLLELIKAAYYFTLDRIRSTKYLILNLLIIILVSNAAPLQTSEIIIMNFSSYRGIYNSAWLGTSFAVVYAIFMFLFGFFIVRGSIGYDSEYNIIEIFSSMNITKAKYILMKFISNFMVFIPMILVLFMSIIFIQIIRKEESQIILCDIIVPILVIVIPIVIFISAEALLMETIGIFKGLLGSFVHFLLWTYVTVVVLSNNNFFDLTGISFVFNQIREVIGEETSVVIIGNNVSISRDIFMWDGITITKTLIFNRVILILISCIFIIISISLFRWRTKTSYGLSNAVLENVINIDSTDSLISEVNEKFSESDFHEGKLAVLLNLIWFEVKILYTSIDFKFFIVYVFLTVMLIVTKNNQSKTFIQSLILLTSLSFVTKIGFRDDFYMVNEIIRLTLHRKIQIFAKIIFLCLFYLCLCFGSLVHIIVGGYYIGLIKYLISALIFAQLVIIIGRSMKSGKIFEIAFCVLTFLGPFQKIEVLDFIDYQNTYLYNILIKYQLFCIILSVYLLLSTIYEVNMRSIRLNLEKLVKNT